MKKIVTGAVVLLSATLAHAQYSGTAPSNSGTPSTSSPSTTSPSTPATPSTPSTTVPGTTEKTPAISPSGTGTSVTNESSSTWPGNVTVLTVEQGKRTEAQANLSAGQHLDKTYLPNRCLSDSDQAKLSGNQVLFGFTLPADTDVKISVVPKDIKQPLNVYAYTQPAARYDMPDKTSSLWTGKMGSTGTGSSTSDIDCKTSFGGKTSIGKTLKGDDRVIRFDGKKVARNIVIGVAAPSGVTSEDFVVTVEATKD